MRRGRTSLHAVFVLLLAGGSGVSAQARGRVSDAMSGRPLWGVLVSVLGREDAVLATALSDSAGRFVLGAQWPEPVRLRLDRLGYDRLETLPLTFTGRDTNELELRLTPRPIQLPELVAAARRSQSNLAGFLRRREVRKFGEFMGPGELAAVNARSGDRLLELFPGIQRDLTGPGVLGRAGYTISPGLRGTRSAAVYSPRQLGCHPWIYVDGRPMEPWRVGYGHDAIDEPTSLDFHLPVHAIRGVEVYRYWYDAPAQYIKGTNRDCAIILVWTDLGFGFREPIGK